MDKELNELAISFNIAIQEDIKTRLKEIQRKLNTEISERRNYESSPHLAVCTKFMPQNLVNEYTKAIKENFSDIPSFTITFTEFAPSPTNNYIFLNLDEQSRSTIFELNRKIKEVTNGIGNESLKGLPPKYPYDPHISIIKLKDYQIKKALQLLNDSFGNVQMVVESFELTVEKRDESGFASFPTHLVLKTV